MPRLQIELTSARPDGTWTWRVAGARQPRGTVEGALLPSGAKVGDVLRVDAEVELEGTVVTAVLAEPRKRDEPNRLEILGSPKTFEAVTTSLVPKGARPRRSMWDGGDRGPRPERRGGPAAGRPGDGGRPGGRPAEVPRRDGSSEAGPGPAAGARPRGDRAVAGPTGRSRPERSSPRGGRPGDRATPGEARGGAHSGPRSDRPGGPRTERGGPPRAGRDAAPADGPPRPKRLNPANTHRAAVLAELGPAERPIAEQLLQGGVPAVRRALREQPAAADGQSDSNAAAILSLAEQLLPRLKTAEWRDRAEAAVADVDEITLRDLRSVVAGADVARDDETRLLAKTLREALDRRDAKERQDWLDDIGTNLTEGRLVRALRVAARPPDPRTRFPAELATRLTDAASEALGPDTPADRWLTVLDAVIGSPVRRAIKPAGLPNPPTPELLNAARQASGRIPALAAMLGISIPPPPMPIRRPGRPVAKTPRRIPPPPPRQIARPAPEAPADAPQTPAEALEAPVEAPGDTDRP